MMPGRNPMAGLRRPADEELNAVMRDPRFLAAKSKADSAYRSIMDRARVKIEAMESAEVARAKAAWEKIAATRQDAENAALEASQKIEHDAYAKSLARIIRNNGL